MNEFLSLREAAEVAGTSKTKLWRSIQDGILEAQTSDRGRQKVYQVSRKALEAWVAEQPRPVTFQAAPEESRPAQERYGESFRNVPDSETTWRNVSSNVSNRYSETAPEASADTASEGRFVPLEAFESTQSAFRAALQDALEVAREQREDRIEAERRAAEAEQRAMRIARQAQALADELGSQKRLLAENAESTIERRAEFLETSARAEEALAKAEALAAREEQAKAQFEELYRHNAEEKARYEREREELLEKLKLSHDKATKFEKLPRWVAKLFGT